MKMYYYVSFFYHFLSFSSPFGCHVLLSPTNQPILKVPVRFLFPISQLTPKLDSSKNTETSPVGRFLLGKIVFMCITAIRLN